MFTRSIITTVCCCLVTASSVTAQHGTSIFDRLLGTWTGEGTLMGRAATYSMTWKKSGGFAILEFSNGFAGANGITTPVLNSVAVYRTASTKPEAVWLDSRPEKITITWESTDTSLTSQWSSPTERGQTTYNVRSSTEIEVIDEVWRGDELQVFGRALYTAVRDGRH